MTDDMAKRIEQLETTIAYQDAAIEELREALAMHFREIETLKREIANFGIALREVEAHPALAGEPEPPPPHY